MIRVIKLFLLHKNRHCEILRIVTIVFRLEKKGFTSSADNATSKWWFRVT